MIWQEQVGTIVMVTQLIENGKVSYLNKHSLFTALKEYISYLQYNIIYLLCFRLIQVTEMEVDLCSI